MITTSINNNDLLIIRNLFNTTIGTSIIKFKKTKIFNNETKAFFDLLKDIRSLPLIRYNENIKQFHLLHVLGLLYLDFNDNYLKMEYSEFMDDIYFPNMMNIISSNFFDQCATLITKQAKEAYNEIRDQSKEVIDFYLIFYRTEPTIIHSDIVSKFIKGSFLKEDPVNMDDIKSEYLFYFKEILYSYIKNRTSNILDFELDPSILEEDNLMNMSSRYRIYEKGLRVSHIQQLCKSSETLTHISKNYDMVRNNILTNELQQLYHFIIDNNRVVDNKLLILKSNSENYSLNKISIKLPLIYKLLRSLHINTENRSIFTENDKKMICDTIYNVIYSRISNKLDNINAQLLSKTISLNLTKSLFTGSFIDPYTMKPLDITGCLFARQLRKFLEILLSDMGV
ncbi:MAG: hypothetical protein H8D97_00930 [Proteobacteria bacterium]|nr:hypothetical protein [Pseudomonadota bacterium]